jgi:hypothetical protein
MAILGTPVIQLPGVFFSVNGKESTLQKKTKNKAGKLSQCSGPKSTYEKQPIGRAQIIIQNKCQLLNLLYPRFAAAIYLKKG